MTRTATLLFATCLFASACAGNPPAPPTDAGTAAPATISPDPGVSLPDSGAQVRVVNLFADDSGPQEVDVYGFAGSDMVSQRVLVASVAYGTASTWFDT